MPTLKWHIIYCKKDQISSQISQNSKNQKKKIACLQKWLSKSVVKI